jgi:exosortase J
MKIGVLQSASAAAQDSSAPSASEANTRPDLQVRTDRATWMWIAVLAVLGAIGLSSDLLNLWDVWTDDPLRSIGMLIVPASVILTLRVWRQTGWELRGSWWGLLPATVGLSMSAFRHMLAWSVFMGPMKFSFLAPKIALYLLGSGFVLLFGGVRVWRRAWFPLALLLCAQPVPNGALVYGDLPLQNLSAHIARSFAVLIGFPPSSKEEMLRLMFTPDFGMFIAPGCDGVRGALTLGYLALITGYLKKVTFRRWIAYVCGGVMLGYLFNLIRLCALVLYYRIAAGHPRLEHSAKWADYMIGGTLFLIAALLFLWVVSRKSEDRGEPAGASAATADFSPREKRAFYWRAAVFSVVTLLFAVPGVNALRSYRKNFAAQVRDGDITTTELDARLPKQVGAYALNRAWQEIFGSHVAMELGAYDGGSAHEVTLGVWLLSREHNAHGSWIARGEDPLMRGDTMFLTAGGRPTQFDTAFYTDGVTDSIGGNAFCTPGGCIPSQPRPKIDMRFLLNPPNFESPGHRAIPIFFRIDRPHKAGDQAAIYEELTVEAQRFVAGIDFGELSRRFQ